MASRVFDPAKAARLDDPARLDYLPLAQVLALLDAPPNALVIDFGAGTGFYDFLVAQARPDLTLVAVDRQPEMLALLRARPGFADTAQRITTAVPADLPRFAGRADRVLCINVLHELDDVHLDEIRDVLHPSGMAVAIDWDESVPREIGPHGPHIFDGPRARSYLEARGFTIRDEARLFFQFALRFERRS